MPLRKPSNFLNMDLTFTVAGKGIVNNAGDLKLDAAAGYFIAPQKGIKFGSLGASAKAIDFSGSGIDVNGSFLYKNSENFWRGDGYLQVGVLVSSNYVSTVYFRQTGDSALPFILTKCTVAVTAPGAGKFCIRAEVGTNPGTLKLVSYAGTSTTGAVLQDNVGAGN